MSYRVGISDDAIRLAEERAHELADACGWEREPRDDSDAHDRDTYVNGATDAFLIRMGFDVFG